MKPQPINQFPTERSDAMTADADAFDRHRPSTRTDSAKRLAAMLAVRWDAAESMFFARQLEFIRPGLLEVLYPDLIGKTLVPVNNSVPAGAEQYTYRVSDHVGTAVVTSDYSERAPTADVKGFEYTQQIRGIQIAYQYTLQEARAAMVAGLPLDVRKAMAARDVAERKLDDVIFNGDTAGTLVGLLGLSNTNTYTIPNGAKGVATWFDTNGVATKTPDEVVQDMHKATNKIVTDSLNIERPDTMLLPLTSYDFISTTRMGFGSDRTILEFFLSTSPFIKQVVQSHKGETAGVSSGRRMVVYKRDPMKLEVIIPQEFEQLPPQQEGFRLITHCHMRTGGVVLYYPKSVLYADGF